MIGRHTFRTAGSQRQDSGQAMVEFMLAISFVFILFVSILQMILLMHAYNTLADAAKEGVRYAIVHGTQNSNCSGPLSSTICTSPDTSNANVKTAVTNFAGLSFQNITPGNVNVAYGPSIVGGANCNNPGCSVRVTVFHLYNPFFGLGWPSITLNAAAEGRIMN